MPTFMPRGRGARSHSGDLFRAAAEKDSSLLPLAERMRPRTLDELLGQRHILGPNTLLREAIETDQVPSLILWGPPGSGKTTLARVIARATKAELVALSAVDSGVKDLREAVQAAELRWVEHRRKTLLFIDEIHRFNKAQQDALLPHVERGLVTLIGATTENPSFEVISALLSRCRVFALRPLEEDDLRALLDRALRDEERGLGKSGLSADPQFVEHVVRHASGDARRALNALEAAAARAKAEERALVTEKDAEEALQQKTLLYDKGGDAHYDTVSAFIKSLRGSDPDAAVYYLVRMLEAGEEPRFLLRRMVIFASEDVGNAEPRALQVAVDALRAFELVGLPEGVLPMTQAAAFLASCPKSNSVLAAYSKTRAAVLERGPLPVPLKLRNAPTPLMKSMGYAGGYRYPHNFEGNYVPEEYLPDELRGRRFYEPSESGEEARIKARLDELRRLRAAAEGVDARMSTNPNATPTPTPTATSTANSTASPDPTAAPNSTATANPRGEEATRARPSAKKPRGS